jgi:hypothetical protein
MTVEAGNHFFRSAPLLGSVAWPPLSPFARRDYFVGLGSRARLHLRAQIRTCPVLPETPGVPAPTPTPSNGRATPKSPFGATIRQPDTVKSVRQDMDQEAADVSQGGPLGGSRPCRCPKTPAGRRAAMRRVYRPTWSRSLSRPGEGPLCIDRPLGVPRRRVKTQTDTSGGGACIPRPE